MMELLLYPLSFFHFFFPPFLPLSPHLFGEESAQRMVAVALIAAIVPPMHANVCTPYLASYKSKHAYYKVWYI